ncbi:MAG: DNA recombination protein RmuC [Sinobacteraceae bacterium]|nr:DNA recombination protein RmuC [Nevskiaceae bacterium]
MTNFLPLLLLALLAGALVGAAALFLRLRPALRERDSLRANLAARESELPGLRERLAALERETTALREKNGELGRQSAQLEERLSAERRVAQEKLALLEDARAKLADAFKALSAEALKSSNESFLKLAQESLARFQQGAKADLEARQKAIEQLAQPIRERLEKFDGKLDELEKNRIGAYRALSQQVSDLLQVHLPQLHQETKSLVQALRQPQARGRWGELQLKRVVEMAGMLEHCDFEEQVSQNTDAGRLRPDLIVRLPGGRQIVVDAKAPVDAYLAAVEAQSEEARAAALARHAQQVKNHITQLAKKSYFDQFDVTPEFVVLFVPGEAFFSAALAHDPGLIEYGAENRVIPASPTTLIALLKAVAYGWRQEALAKNAAEVAALGKDLYERIATLAEHWSNVGDKLDKAVDAYNKSVGALESRVLPAARRFRDLRAASDAKDIPALEPLTQETRAVTAEELVRRDKNGANE